MAIMLNVQPKVLSCLAFIFIMLLAHATDVVCVPVPLGIEDEHYLQVEAPFATLKKGFVRAQFHLDNLQRLLETDTPARRKVLLWAFGKLDMIDLGTIIKNVNKLAAATSLIRIEDVKEITSKINKGVYAYTLKETPTNRVAFTEEFYGVDEEDMAGIIIHEAGHALLDLLDYFHKVAPHKGTYGPEDPAYDGTPVWCGYESKDFHILTHRAPQVTHLSAEAYAVAALLASRVKGLQSASIDKINHAIADKPAFKMTRPYDIRMKAPSRLPSPGPQLSHSSSHRSIQLPPLHKAGRGQ